MDVGGDSEDILVSGYRLRAFLQQLRGATQPPAGCGSSDAQLLERWLTVRDDAAFELLLRRHGQMVLGVCRRLLRQPQDVEDAFQATFLILVRKAPAVGKREAVGSWLYKVAFRVALRARARAARQVPSTSQELDRAAPEAPDELMAREVRAVLDEEVSRLPERYRAAFVLCCLEGKTYEEAACDLGLRPGTVASRLTRARQRLRSGLARKGLSPSAGHVVPAPAIFLPAALVRSTMRAALLGAADQAAAAGVLTAQAAALTKGVLRAMWITQVKTAAVALLTATLIGGGGVATYRTLAAGPDDTPGREPKPLGRAAGAQPAPLEKLEREDEDLKKQLDEARRRAAALEEQLRQSLDRNKQMADRLAVLEKELAQAKEPPARRDAARLPERPQRAPELPALPAGLAGTAEALQAEIELLETRLAAKEAEVEAARVTLRAAASKHAALADLFKRGTAEQRMVVEAEQEVAKCQAQLRIKEAELREPQVRLQQAQRRLGELQGRGRQAPAPDRAGLEQRLRQLESQFDDLRRQLDELHRQLQLPAAPRR